MVFRYPADPSLDYIKRVVGLPGDKIDYKNKRLTINGAEIKEVKAADYLLADRLYYQTQYRETLGEIEHSILVDNDAPAFVSQTMQFPYRDKCLYNSSGFSCEVPKGHYFMMGDNRDASSDSRIWGFVPEENIVGKAFLIWFNFSDLKRVGSFK